MTTERDPEFITALEQSVKVYRRLIGKRDSVTDDHARDTLDRIARKMRDAWREYPGGGDLHEMAFGKPE